MNIYHLKFRGAYECFDEYVVASSYEKAVARFGAVLPEKHEYLKEVRQINERPVLMVTMV